MTREAGKNVGDRWCNKGDVIEIIDHPIHPVEEANVLDQKDGKLKMAFTIMPAMPFVDSKLAELMVTGILPGGNIKFGFDEQTQKKVPFVMAEYHPGPPTVFLGISLVPPDKRDKLTPEELRQLGKKIIFKKNQHESGGRVIEHQDSPKPKQAEKGTAPPQRGSGSV